MNWAVVLAGGVGERFWPASTPARPKQLLPLLSERSMLRETVDRLDGVVPPERRLVLTNGPLAETVAGEVPETPRANVIGEPEGRNTAPAIGLAAGLLHARDPDAVLVALPADHAVGDVDAFRDSLATAFGIAAERPAIVVFGVLPNRPETGYGYIERGSPAGPAFEVARFVEKPDAQKAGRLWRTGRHFWNAGLFCGRAQVFLDEYAVHLPLVRRAIDAAVRRWEDDPVGALAAFYDAVEATSIDVGIMQRTERALVLPATGWGWDDVGSWEALGRWIAPAGDGNVEIGDALLRRCRDVIAWVDSGRVVALGVEGLVIVRTETETLVASRAALDGIRDVAREATAARRTDR